MPDYDKLAQQYGGGGGAAADQYDQLAQKFAGMAADARPKPGPGAQPTQPGALDRVRAAAAGVNRGFFSDLLGIPVDTIENVLDLGRAGIGTLATKAGRPDLAPNIPDRASIVGSSDWIAHKLGSAAANPSPQDGLSRVLYMGGRGAGASIVPNPRAALSAGMQLTNAGMGAISGLTNGAVGEVAPEWAGLAGMLPSAAIAGGANAIKAAVRGGEAGRQKMAQRIQDLSEGGVEAPSVGLASGNRTFMGLENLLAQTPGSTGLYERAGQANIAGMKAKADATRDAISSDFGPVSAGAAVQAALKGSFRDRVNSTTRTLNDKVAEKVGPNFYTLPENALDSARGMSAVNPAAPATSQALQNKRIANIADDLSSDVKGTPILGSSLMNQPTRYKRSDGEVMDTQPGIPFQTLKNLRTSIGEEANSAAILGTPEGAQFKRLYGAMSQDMRKAAGAADRSNSSTLAQMQKQPSMTPSELETLRDLLAKAGTPAGSKELQASTIGPLMPSQTPATMALNRANTFYGRAATRAEDLNGIANRDTPEGAYSALANSLNNGPSLYEKLRGAVDTKTRQSVAATVVDELGTARPGQQNVAGDVWSPRTFLTNYAKLYENGGGNALFKRLPGGETHAGNLASIAKTADMLGDSSKVWANPSGTAPAMTARGTLYTLTAGAFLNPMLAVSTAGGLAGAGQLSQRLLLNPKFVNWLAKAPSVPPAQAQAYAQRLMATAILTKDDQFKQDATDYLRLVEDGQK